VRTRIDAWSGGKPGPWTQSTKTELFRSGTQPGTRGQVDRPGLLYSLSCGTWSVDPLKAELGPRSWDRDVADWLARARRGTGVQGRLGSSTAYFWDRSGWGGRLAGPCYVPRPVVVAPPRPTKGADHNKGNGGGKPKPPPKQEPPATQPPGTGNDKPKP
jgi:hypothetical protein